MQADYHVKQNNYMSNGVTVQQIFILFFQGSFPVLHCCKIGELTREASKDVLSSSDLAWKFTDHVTTKKLAQNPCQQ